MLLRCVQCDKEFVASKSQQKRSRHCKKNQPKRGFTCSFRCAGKVSASFRNPKQRYSPDRLARCQLNAAVQDGRIKRPVRCERCSKKPKPDRIGRTQIDGHHHDYSKPFDVEWLCKVCHRAETPNAGRKKRDDPRVLSGQFR